MSYVTVSLPPEIGMALLILTRHARQPGSVAEGAVLPAVLRLEEWQRSGYILNDDELQGALQAAE